MDTICEICVVLNNLFFVSCQMAKLRDAGFWILDSGTRKLQVTGCGLHVFLTPDS